MELLHVIWLIVLLASTSDAALSRKPTMRLNYGNEVKNLQDNLVTVARQLMLQQLYTEEQTRSNGDSGLKQVRGDSQGTRPYYSASHTGRSFASMHDHANNDRTVGMGEFIAVLNGVEFRTRHNDYRLKMKSRNSSDYGAVEDIPFPSVPPEVTQHLELDDQILEMREWFKAWRDQDHSVRDYRQYFKPVLCYLEGGWTHSDQNSIDEPFDSDRHHIDATSWHDLLNKIRFTSYSGAKDGLENLAYLPTTIINMLNDTIPVLAQWNFAILCHPLKDHLPLNRILPVDDLRTRLSMDDDGMSMRSYLKSRGARFQVSTFDEDEFTEGSKRHSLLDDLMEQIPGKDNYPGNTTDELFGDQAYEFNKDSDNPLNAAYYHRWFRVVSKGAMGLRTRRRGFADSSLFVARTDSPKIPELELTTCVRKNRKGCIEEQVTTGRYTYAIPLEIIYMTPLSSWNPYELPYRGEARSQEGKTVYEGPSGRRNGGSTPDKAYNGTNSKTYYMTPLGFFDNEFLNDPADTTKSSTCVLDSGTNVKCVKASGHRIFLPNIPGVGVLRQRYPVAPVHGEGSAVWKELEALKSIVMQPKRFEHMYWEQGDDGENTAPPTERLRFRTQPSASKYGSHKHYFTLTKQQHQTLLDGRPLTNVITEDASQHSHNLTIVKRGERYRYTLCDGQTRCFDRHPIRLLPV